MRSHLCTGQSARGAWNKELGAFWPWRFVEGRAPVLPGALLESVCLSTDPQKWSAPWKSHRFPSLPLGFPSGMGAASTWSCSSDFLSWGRWECTAEEVKSPPWATSNVRIGRAVCCWVQWTGRLPSEGSEAGCAKELERQLEDLWGVGWGGGRMWW